MTRRSVGVVVLGLVLVACGGEPDASTSENTSSGGATEDASSDGGGEDQSGEAEGGGGLAAGGDVVDPQPPGQARVSVDGQEWTFTEPGAGECSIAADTFTFSFRIGDNEVTLGAGANLYDGTGWLGSIDLRVPDPDPDGGAGVVHYLPDLAGNADSLAIDGNSLSYSGPMQRQPPNDGSNPPPEDVGQGIISVTCG